MPRTVLGPSRGSEVRTGRALEALLPGLWAESPCARDEEGLTELHPRSVWAGGLRGAILVQREALARGERGERQPLPRVEWGSVPRGGSSLWECKGRGAELRRAGAQGQSEPPAVHRSGGPGHSGSAQI